MSHYDLIKMAQGLGLSVVTDMYYNEMLRRKEQLFTFRTDARFLPGVGYTPGDLIARLKYHSDMEPMEYQDACGALYNTLKQFESWR